MKYLLTLTLTLFVSLTLFGKPLDRKTKKDFKKDRIEKLKKIQTKKYELIKEKLTSEERKKILPIIKKYDRKIMNLRVQQMKRGKEFKQKWNIDSKKFVSHAKEKLEVNREVTGLRLKEIEELEASGVSYKVIEELIKFERRFQHKFHKRIKNRKVKRRRMRKGNSRRGMRNGNGQRGMRNAQQGMRKHRKYRNRHRMNE